MAITFQSKFDQTSFSSYSFDVGTGSNRFLFVLVMRRGGSSTSVTYGGVSMTSLGSVNSVWNSGDYSELFILKNPSSGSNTVAITHNGSLCRSTGASYNGVNQTTPTGDYTTKQSSSSAPQAITINPTTPGWLVCSGWIAVSTTLTPDSNTTMRTTGAYGANPVLDSNAVKSSSYSIGYTDSIAGDLLGFVLIPDTSAPTVTTQAVSAITNTTATGNGNVTSDGGATITERGVCIGASANPTTSGTKFTTTGTTGAFTVSMTDLTKNTHYHARAYAINSIGTSYGADVEFDTTNTPDELRYFTNRPGIEYDAEKTTVVFAEDMALIKEWIEYLNSKL